MKKIFTLFLIAAAMVLAAGELPRKCVIGKTAGTLKPGKIEIVTAAKPCPVIQYAVNELKNALEKVLNTRIPVVNKPSAGKVSFILGENEWSKKAGLTADKTIRDSFTIRNTADKIYILGVDDPKLRPGTRGYAGFCERGTLFGVYEWVERFAGVRYYFYGELGEVYPQKKELPFPQAEIFHYPQFANRSLGIAGVLPGNLTDPNLKYRAVFGTRYRPETEPVPHCHGLRFMGYPERFDKTHPEYMALQKNGKRFTSKSFRPHLCYSSGVREEIYQDMASWFKGEPASKRGILYRGKVQWYPHVRKGYFDMMPDDSFRGCQCEKCKKQWTNEQEYATEFMWSFVAECANRLKKEGINGKVTQMAYYPYNKVPKVALPDNVLVKVADLGPWGVLNKAKHRKSVERIKEWSKKVAPHTLRLWVYLCKFGDNAFPGVPSPTPAATGLYFTDVAPYINGAFIEAETDRYINNYLVMYIYCKIAWNPGIDYRAIIAEHHKLMFGKAAPEMAQIFSRFEELWLTKIVGRTIFTDIGPVVSPPSDQELWNKIYSEKELKSLKALFDRAAVKTKGDKLASRRVALFRTEWFEELQKNREEFVRNSSAKDDLCAAAGEPLYLGRFGYKNPTKPTHEYVQTKVTFSRKDGNLIFVFDCDEPKMDKAYAVKRDKETMDIWRDSGVEVFLNPSGDRKSCYHIIANLAGNIADERFVCDGVATKGNDLKWNSNCTSKVEKFAKSYRITLTVPEKNLGKINPAGFPANFCRNRTLSNGGLPDLFCWGAPILKRYNDAENFGSILFQPKAEKNFVENGDFTAPDRENGKSHGAWYGENPIRFRPQWRHEIDKSEFFCGGQSLKMVSDGKGLTLDVTQFLKGLKPNTKYRLSYFVKLKDVKPLSRNCGFYAQFQYGVKRGYPKNPLYGSSNWSKQYFEITTPAKVDKAPFLQFRLFKCTGTAWVDHAEIVELKK